VVVAYQTQKAKERLEALRMKIRLSKIRNKNFTVICNNCIGWGIYKTLDLQYTTPTIGLFFMAEDYIKFLERFEYYIHQPLTFLKETRHKELLEYRKDNPWVIGTLGDGIEIQFLHYFIEEDVANKWFRRVNRINFDNLFFIYSDKYSFKEEYLERYLNLPFKHKLFFSALPRQGENVIYMKEYLDDKVVGESWLENRFYERYIDIVKWLNGNKNFLKKSEIDFADFMTEEEFKKMEKTVSETRVSEVI
jgi:uncharacterized protein (DUF1919 family)